MENNSFTENKNNKDKEIIYNNISKSGFKTEASAGKKEKISLQLEWDYKNPCEK